MIYFDNAATTRPSAAALEKAARFNGSEFFNASALYRGGLKNAAELNIARDFLLKSLGVSSSEYEAVFTSCGSESDNMAIFGAVKRGVFVTDKGEHAAVYKSFCELKSRKLQTEFIDLNRDGSVSEEKLLGFVQGVGADFVSIVHVNNETGAVNDINKIADKLKKINQKIIFHSDGVQAYGKLPVRLSKSVDLYSVSAHKVNGLKGTGALIKKRKLNVSPLIFGGGQESGLRSGTENIFGIKVFEYAAAEKLERINENYAAVSEINRYLRNALDKCYVKILSSEAASPYILSVSVPGFRGEVVMHALEDEDIIVGNGSACSSRNRYSRVMESCGYSKQELDGVIRLSFSADNTLEEAKIFAEKFNGICKRFKGVI